MTETNLLQAAKLGTQLGGFRSSLGSAVLGGKRALQRRRLLLSATHL
jgi:hypothetical protein